MMGDGATNQGTFGETMNLAALWKLPVVFLIINNQFGMGTALHRHSAVTDLSLKSEGFGVPGTRCDGMDVLDVHAVVTKALACAREERKPQLVEAVTYRYRGHSMADPEEYRTKEEVEEWRGRDPIVTFSKRLVEQGVMKQEDVEAIDEQAVATVDESVKFADAVALPRPRLPLRRRVRVLRRRARLVDRGRALSRGAPRRARARGRPASARAGRAGRGLRVRGRRRGAQPPQPQGRGRGRARLGRAGGRGRRRLMPVMRYREALAQALREEMQEDESVFVMGEDVGVFQGAFKVTAGLLEEFGEKRVRDTPISENTIVGMGVGAAMTGLRPVVEIMTINFSLLAMDQIVNHAAAIHYMFGGQAKVPLVIRMPQGAGHQLGPTHSHCFEAFFLHVPGLLVAVPSTPADAKGLLKAAIRDDNPVVFIEHETLYGQRGEVPENGGPMRFGEAAVRREGDDVTVVGISRMAVTAQKAAETLAERHEIEAEVIDPRTLRPLDLDTILDSVKKTNRAVIVEEGWPHGGVGANLAALIQEQAFDWLDAPVQRVTGADVPMPYSKPLEQAAFPHEEHIVQAALATFRDSLMATDVTMPRLSDSMEEGTVLKWLVEEGAEVKRGEPLVEIETDKANMTYESDTDGVLIEIVAQEGDTLPIGETIARVGEAGEAGGGDAKGDAEPAEQEAEAEPEDDEPKSESKEPAERESSNGGGAPAPKPARAAAPAGGGDSGGERVKASPVARRVARDLGVEIARLEGTGPGGRIVKADVEAAAGGNGAGHGHRGGAREEGREAHGSAPSPRAARPGPRARWRSTSSRASSRR